MIPLRGPRGSRSSTRFSALKHGEKRFTLAAWTQGELVVFFAASGQEETPTELAGPATTFDAQEFAGKNLLDKSEQTTI
jgi:hypothetical protein